MRRLMWVSVLSVSVCLVNGVGLAQAQTIYPISNPAGPAPFVPDTGSSVTVTLSSSNWLPSPGATVIITVNVGGSPTAAAAISLVCPDGTTTNATSCPPLTGTYNPITAGALRTSAYPGVCTNYSDPSLSISPFAVDFTLNGNVLTSLDCGGMAVIQVSGVTGGPYTFIIPQDSDFDGIPDIWEAKFGPASGSGSLTKDADPDNDGFSNFDEYRGVMLTGSSGSLTHTRLHPLERDLFVALVNPGCGATDGFLDNLGTTPTYIPNPTNARSLFDNLNTLLPATATDPPGPRVHPVGYPTGAPVTHGAVNAEWKDDYTGCSFNIATGDLVFSGLSDLDRLVTRNALYRVSESPNTTLIPSATTGTGITFTAGANIFNQTHVNATIASGSGLATITAVPSPTRVTANITAAFASTSVIAAGAWRVNAAGQKGLRCVESLDTSSTTVFASSGWATSDDTLSCTIFSKRIEFRMKNTDTTLGPLGLIPKGGTRLLRIQTTPDGGRSWTTLFTQGSDRAEAERRVVAEVMRFYATMEYGHGGKLKPTLGTCGAHDCAGTGYILDKDFVQVIDSKTTGFNTFRIPTISNSTLTGNFKLRTP